LRLFTQLSKVGWTQDDCSLIAPLTLEINNLKKEQDAIILAHSYQTPDIMYGVADHVGDSYGLSVIASKTKARKIVFCSVHFMGETAKILSPEKEVLVPTVAGCSLAESITAEEVRKLKEQHPGIPVVCYVNTSASVKAESDACCTSANAQKIVEAFPSETVIFIPDVLMGRNLQKLTSKKLILWHGTCIVHDKFRPETIDEVRKMHPGVKVLAHTECEPVLVEKVDMAGSTTSMLNYVKNSSASDFMLITECGLTDRVKAEFPSKNIVGTCNLCPYMKSVMLKDILKALKNPSPEQRVEIPPEILKKAKHSLDRMFELEKKYDEMHK